MRSIKIFILFIYLFIYLFIISRVQFVPLQMTSSSAPRKCKENITPTELMLIASLQKRKRTGKEYCCFPLFKKVTYSNERSTKLESLETLKNGWVALHSVTF